MLNGFVQLHSGNYEHLHLFLKDAGDSLDSFRYFDKRPISIVLNHLYCGLFFIEGEAVAYGHLEKESEIVWLGIAVKANLKGQGLGKKMIEHLVQKARELKLKRVRLSVDNENISAIFLYKKYNFELLEKKDTISFYELKL